MVVLVVVVEDEGHVEFHVQPLLDEAAGLDIFQSPAPVTAKPTPFDDLGMFDPTLVPSKPAPPVSLATKPSANPNPATFDPFQPFNQAASKPVKPAPPPNPSPATSATIFDPFNAFEPTSTPVVKPPKAAANTISFDLLDSLAPVVTPTPKQDLSRPSSGSGSLLETLPSAFQSFEPELDQIFPSSEPLKVGVPTLKVGQGPAPPNTASSQPNQAASSSGNQWGTFDPFGSLSSGKSNGSVLKAEPLRPNSSSSNMLLQPSVQPGPPSKSPSMSKAYSTPSIGGTSNGAAAQPFKPNYNPVITAGFGVPTTAAAGRGFGQPGPSPHESPRVSPIHFAVPSSGAFAAKVDPFADLGAVKVSKLATPTAAPPPSTKANVPPMTFRPTYQVYGSAVGAQTQANQQRNQPAKTESKPVFTSVIGEREEKGSRVMTGKDSSMCAMSSGHATCM